MKKLHEYITENLEKEFKWGEHDCCLFTVGWIENVSGKDYLTQYKPWHTAKEAIKIVKNLGGLPSLFDTNLKAINPNFAVDGDVTVVRSSAMIFSGEHIVGVGESGLMFLDRGEATNAWKII